MACCLTAPRYCQNQCWLVINMLLWHSRKDNTTGNVQDIYIYINELRLKIQHLKSTPHLLGNIVLETQFSLIFHDPNPIRFHWWQVSTGEGDDPIKCYDICQHIENEIWPKYINGIDIWRVYLLIKFQMYAIQHVAHELKIARLQNNSSKGMELQICWFSIQIRANKSKLTLG